MNKKSITLQLRFCKKTKRWKFRDSRWKTWQYAKELEGKVMLSSRINIFGGSLLLHCDTYSVQDGVLLFQ